MPADPATVVCETVFKHSFDIAKRFEPDDPRFLRTRPERSRAGDPLREAEKTKG